MMVTVQAFAKDMHPDPCGKSSCVKGGKASMFYTSLCLLALGAGGVKGSIAQRLDP
jgi:peptide/histidine transporter 3/4